MRSIRYRMRQCGNSAPTASFYTVPFVLYGIFRYLYLVHKKEAGGNPTKLALTDLPLLINITLWIITASIIIYGR